MVPLADWELSRDSCDLGREEREREREREINTKVNAKAVH